MRSLFLILVLSIIIAAVAGRKICKPVKEPKCQKHATYNACGPNRFCYTTCGGPRGPPCRLEGCTAGCFCDEGYILNVADNKCIDPKDCTAGFGY